MLPSPGLNHDYIVSLTLSYLEIPIYRIDRFRRKVAAERVYPECLFDSQICANTGGSPASWWWHWRCVRSSPSGSCPAGMASLRCRFARRDSRPSCFTARAIIITKATIPPGRLDTTTSPGCKDTVRLGPPLQRPRPVSPWSSMLTWSPWLRCLTRQWLRLYSISVSSSRNPALRPPASSNQHRST